MATILLSIKPEYANKIFDGQKHYEYRKRIPKKEVSKIVVYSSAPEQAVIGEIEVIKTLKMKPKVIRFIRLFIKMNLTTRSFSLCFSQS